MGRIEQKNARRGLMKRKKGVEPIKKEKKRKKRKQVRVKQPILYIEKKKGQG